MSKRHFKGDPCVYCQDGISTRSGDHIFARGLFLTNRRDAVPKVPACIKCNHLKSQLEQYLLTILPLGARHEDALENLRIQTPKRLAQNLKLHRELSKGRKYEYVLNEGGIYEQQLSIEFDLNKLLILCNFITRALVNVHFGILLDDQHTIVSTIELKDINSFLNGSSKQKIEKNLGQGTIEYKGVQALDNPSISAWEYIFYGGLEIPGRESKSIFSYSGPQSLFRRP